MLTKQDIKNQMLNLFMKSPSKEELEEKDRYISIYQNNQKNSNQKEAIKLTNLVIDFGETKAVNNISWSIKKGELVTLLGPSGCGKTTTLNAISGIITPTSGQISFFGKNVTTLSSRQRNLGLVFQNYALYPHMNVYKNIAFPLVNDSLWKKKVLYKNRKYLIENDIIRFKKAGISSSKIDQLMKLYNDIKYLKEGIREEFERSSINITSDIQNLKAEIALIPQKYKTRVSKLSENILNSLKQGEKDLKKKLISKEDLKKIKDKLETEYKTQKQEFIAQHKRQTKALKHQLEKMTKRVKESDDFKKHKQIKRYSIVLSAQSQKEFNDYYRSLKKEYKNIIQKNPSKKDLSPEEEKKIELNKKTIIKIKDAIHKEVMIVAERVGIVKNLKKKPTNLSGGQQQRVAIARAIVRRPKVLLMDEPLSNLDAKLRVSTRAWIKKIQRELGITTVFVTHDQEEAMAISDKIILMNFGNVQQKGTPIELYKSPNNLFVAKFLGMPEMSTFNAKTNAKGEIVFKGKIVAKTKFKNKDIVFGIRAENIEHLKTGGIKGIVQTLDVLGKETLALVQTDEDLVKIFTKIDQNIAVGDSLNYKFKPNSIYIFDKGNDEFLGVA